MGDEVKTDLVDAADEGPLTFEKMINGKASEPDEDTDSEDTEEGDEAGSESEESADDESDDEGASDGDEESSEESDEEEGEVEEDADGGDDDNDSASEEEVEDAGEDAEGDLEEVSKAAPKDALTINHKGKEFKLPKDAKITFEKDGRKVTFSMGEVGNNVLTSQEIDRRFSQINNKEKSLERQTREITKLKIEHEELEDSISLIKEAAQEGNLFQVAQATLSMFSKGAPNEVTEKLFKELVTLTEKVSDMTEEQLKTAIGSEQLALRNKLLERDKSKADERAEKERRRNWLTKELSRYNIDFEEYAERWQALKLLDEKREQQGMERRLKDGFTYEDLAKETIRFTLATRHFNKVEKVITKVDPSRKGDNELLDTICQLTDVNFSEKDITDIVREVLGKPAKKVVASKSKTSSKEVSKAPAAPSKKKETESKEAKPEKAAKAKEAKKTDDEDEGPLTFDTLKKRYQ